MTCGEFGTETDFVVDRHRQMGTVDPVAGLVVHRDSLVVGTKVGGKPMWCVVALRVMAA